jgi:hypothetical protein
MFGGMAKKGYVLGGGGYISDGKQQFVLAMVNLDARVATSRDDSAYVPGTRNRF